MAVSDPAVDRPDDAGDKVSTMHKDRLTKSWRPVRTGLMVVALLASGVGGIAEQRLWAAPSSSAKATPQGKTEAGRSFFNGKSSVTTATVSMGISINDRNSLPTRRR